MSSIEDNDKNENNDVVKDQTKQVLKKMGKRIARKLVIILLPIIVVLLLISAITWFIFQDEGTWTDKEKGNPSTYTKNVKLSGTDGISIDKMQLIKKALSDMGYTEEKIESMDEAEIIRILQMNMKLNKTVTSIEDCTVAEILWCINNDYSKYLKKPEDLEYLLNAEIVTQYPKIDGIADDKLNGIIEFVRVSNIEDTNDDGVINIEDNQKKITYISQEDFDTKFQNYIDTGNMEVFNYYTLDESENVIIATWSEEDGSFESNNTALQSQQKIKQGHTESTIQSEYDSRYSVTGNTTSSIAASYITYSANKTSINYKSNVQKYTLPFEYLWALLVIGESDEFVLNLAELAYNSQIVVGIYDSVTTTVTVNTHNYTENFRERFEEKDESGSIISSTEWTNPPKSYSYFETNMITTKNDNAQFDIMYANVWIVEVISNYKNTQTQDNYPPIESTDPDEEWSDNGTNTIPRRHEDTDRDPETNEIISTTVYYTYETYFKEKKTTGQLYQTTQDIYYDKYEKVETKVREKTDIDPATDMNFVKLLRADQNANAMLFKPINVVWLCDDILANNADTANMVELTKYLINKAKNPDDTSLSFDFSIFEPSSFNSININSNILAELLKSYENDALRKYMNGELSDYSSVKNYVTQDKTKYKLYYTSADGCLNFSYGIMVRNKKGNLNNEGYFAAEGLDLQALINAYDSGQDVYVDVEIIDRIYNKIISDRKQVIKDVLAGKGVQLKTYELDALVNVSYQYGNCGQYISGENNIANLYKNLYEVGKIEEFKQSAQALNASGGYTYFFADSTDTRKKNNWILFSEGRYILRDGTEIASSSAVADFALQFVGEGHSRFTSYSGTQDDWCAMFVSYCYDNCGLIPDVLKESYMGCTAEVAKLKQRGEFIDRTTGYTPQPGDIIFFTKNGGITSYHTGIVIDCDGAKVYTVEGNTGYNSTTTPRATDWSNSWVGQSYYTLTSSIIYGYFSPNK